LVTKTFLTGDEPPTDPVVRERPSGGFRNFPGTTHAKISPDQANLATSEGEDMSWTLAAILAAFVVGLNLGVVVMGMLVAGTQR
jgi:hypothetical protein